MFGLRRLRDYRRLKLIADLPLYAPGSSGSAKALSKLTIQSAQQVFPRLVQVMEANGQVPLEPLSPEAFCDGAEQSASQLANLLDHYGSDKVSHQYHLVYGKILQDRSVDQLIEIGLGTNNEDIPSSMGRFGRPGASLRAFRDFLPGAAIIGADIDRRILFSENRIETLFVDQTNPDSFSELGSIAKNFRLLIDDGLHSPNANLTVLKFGLERLSPGGWIVIEDIVPDAIPLWQAVGAILSDLRCAIVRTKTAAMFLVTRP